MIPSLSSLPHFSINLEKNVWADFTELLCLVNPDKEISLGDMISVVMGEAPESPQRGSDESSKEEDLHRQQMLDVFSYLKNRASILTDCYPFVFIDDDTISIDIATLSLKKELYLFLLFCSNLSRFTASDRYTLAKEFEAQSRVVLEKMYPTYHIDIFGTASSPEDMFYGKNLVDRMEKLADCMHTELTHNAKHNPRYAKPSGDGGMDLVGFSNLDNNSAEVPLIPLCFAQCACSVDQWKDKQSSIKYDTWNQRFIQLPHYCEFIFVPFSLRGSDGKWNSADADQMTVIPIDRFRFLHILCAQDNPFDFFSSSKAKEIVGESISQLS